LIEYLADELKDVETEIAVKLLRTITKSASVPKPKLSESDFRRLEKYFDGLSLYEYVSDIFRPVVKYYYSRVNRTEIGELEDKIVVGKVLQLKKWREVKNQYTLLQNSLKKIIEWFGS
jgi:tRNA(Met) cytidine acetyltransferase